MAHSRRSLLLTVSIALVAPLLMTLQTSTAQAQSFHSLRRASDDYRAAVLGFERHVNRANYFDHYDRRLADRLEDVSSDFRSATRNASDVPRILYHWNNLNGTHALVEQTLVVGCGHPDPELVRCWQPVVAALNCLTAEMRCFTGGHRAPHVSNRPDYDSYQRAPVYDESYRDGGFEYQIQPGFGVQPMDPRFGGVRAFPPSQPAVQVRPRTPPFLGSYGSQVDPRREMGAAITATILNRLLN